MDTKVQNIKSKRHKNIDHRQLVSKLAETFRCSVRHVNYAISGERGKRSQLTENIRIAYELLSEEYSKSESKIKGLFTSKKVA